MRDVLDDLLNWWNAGHTVGMGTVTGTFHSAPRWPGAAMLVGPEGTVVGSVSGGCVESAVYELSKSVVNTGTAVAQRYGFSDDDAFAVGLTCGGIIDIFVEPISQRTFPEFGRLAASIRANRPVALATITAGRVDHVGRHLVVWPDDVAGDLGSARLTDAVRDDACGLLTSGRTATLSYGPAGERRGTGLSVFVSSFAPAPRMLVFGAIDFAAAVAKVGSFLGYRVTVCDARPVFATARRFPAADEVVVDWPHRYLQDQVQADSLDQRTVICVLTHDPKFDIPVLSTALTLPVAYVGAMGSRRTHLDRLAKLRQAGVGQAQLDRLSSPIGLDLGARTPEETAISIAAEIVANRWGGTGQELSKTTRPIHHDDRTEIPTLSDPGHVTESASIGQPHPFANIEGLPNMLETRLERRACPIGL